MSDQVLSVLCGVYPDKHIYAENYTPLPWNEAHWHSEGHQQGGQPKVQNENGSAKLSSAGPWDQGEYQTDVGIAIAQVMEYQIGQKYGDSVPISVADIFHLSERGLEKGWFVTPALEFVKNNRAVPDKYWPYSKIASYGFSNPPDIPANVPRHRITDWHRKATIQERKQSIAEQGPVVGSMVLFEDFYDYRGGVYRHRTGDRRGAKAIIVVGYDAESWICQNTWGPMWGEDGYVRIAYGDECGIDTLYFFYEIEGVERLEGGTEEHATEESAGDGE